MQGYPTGIVTFLFSDLEGSTSLWEKFPVAMHDVLAVHDNLLKKAVEKHNGVLIKTTGDGIHAAFVNATDAILASRTAQQAIIDEPWKSVDSIKVRIGIHTGEAQFRDGDYYGTTLNRAARVMSIANGGQTLISQVSTQLAKNDLPNKISLTDLGIHRLKGLSQPEKIFQINFENLPIKFPPLKSLDFFIHNLPISSTGFVGREQDVKHLTDLILQNDVRLVTISGPGGMGKTRLSLEVGGELIDKYQDGVFFVDLAPITNPDLVASTIARAIGIREGGGRPPLENLKDYLKNKTLLLLLDNFEQVTDAAIIVADILSSAANLNVIITSRILLQISGEHEYELSPLALPTSQYENDFKTLQNSPAIQLFIQQAKIAKPSFSLTEENAITIIEICRRLDGLPLALEIAAARIKLLPPRAILKRLDQSLKLLVGGAKDLPTRQQTLRSTIDWSFDLLDDTAKSLFCKLGVFVGGFTFESVEAVCSFDGDIDVLEGINLLINNSLIRITDSTKDEPRFTMLKTIREYALENLEKADLLRETMRSYVAYFANKTHEMGMQIYGKKATYWLKEIEEEYDNIRAILAWGLNNPESLQNTIKINMLLSWFWYRYGHFHEGREWTEKFLKKSEDHPEYPNRNLMLCASGLMAMWEGDLNIAYNRTQESIKNIPRDLNDGYLGMLEMACGVVLINRGKDTEAYPHLVSAIELMDQMGDDWNKSTSLVHLANVSLGLGNPDEATKWLDQAMPAIKNMQDDWQIAFALNNYGEIARTKGDYQEAEKYYLQTAEYYKEADAKGDQARLSYNLGYIELHKGNFIKAKNSFNKSMEEFRKLGNKRGIAECLSGIATLATMEKNFEYAIPLLSAAENLLHSFGGEWWPSDRKEIEKSLGNLRSAVDETTFEILWNQGKNFDISKAIKYYYSHLSATS